jgi:hypothetical protein
MNLHGWNDLPDDCVAEFKFEDGPRWIRILALTPYFERFAYPVAVRRGLGILWCNAFDRVETETLESLGWIIEIREKTKEEKFFEGSLGLLTSKPKQRQRRHISFTRWGRERASRNYVHKFNGTYSHLKNRTLPSGL